MRKTIPIFFILIMHVFVLAAQPKLSSYPTARATIFLDFDGHFVEGTLWNGAGSFYCAPSGMRDNQIIEIFNRVAEDYRPFNVNITTDSSVYLAAPLARRVRVVITPTSDWYPGVGGVAFTGSFTWGDDTPVFVFSDRMGFRAKNVAECCSHESGHSLGLSHQAKYDQCTLVSTYNEGKGTGEIGWAPIMGNSYGRNFSGWNNGPTPYGCTQEQDNLSIITSKNGFTYREDDHGDLPSQNPTSLKFMNNMIASEGVISTNMDKDAFEFKITGKGNLRLDILPFSVGEGNAGANLDVKAVLLDEKFNEISVYDPKDILNVSIDTILTEGKYYVVVSGAGNENTSEYGSLGSYSINGLFSPTMALPVMEAKLQGKILNNEHYLTWEIVSDTRIKEVTVETSADGANFKPATLLPGSATSYNAITFANAYYRIKVTGMTGETLYSNTISLQGVPVNVASLQIKNMAARSLIVDAKENFQYVISDAKGRILQKGNGRTGMTTIDYNSLPQGVYFIKLFSAGESLVKQILRM